MEIFPHKLTQNAKAALVAAEAVARAAGDNAVTPVHLVTAIARQRGSAGAHLLATLGLPADGETPATAGGRRPRMTGELKETIVSAYTIAWRTGYGHVGTEHLLYAAAARQDTAISALLGPERIAALAGAAGARNPLSEQFSRQMTHLLNALHASPDQNDRDQQRDHRTDQPPQDDPEEDTALEHFTVDMTANDRDDRILVGRDDIVDRIVTILSRREKSNPLLVGAPGVGKTAIVEGLARRIREGRVPAHLLDARIVALDLAHLVAGTTFRGEFEARLKDVIADAQDDPRIILFIDELHTIVGAGNAQGSLDAANILKPALSRGEIRVIGATTNAEYKKHFAKDGALARRFQVVHLPEPDRAASVAILQGNRAQYETFHNVHIDPALIPRIVDWSIRFLPDRHLPDKAFDILDEAAALARLERRDDALRHRVLLERAYDDIIRRKNDAIAAERFDEALSLRRDEIRMDDQIATARAAAATTATPSALTAAHVAAATAHLAKVPADTVTQDAAGRVAAALARWRHGIAGQDEAVAAVAATLRRAAAGVAHPDRPQGSFLLLGPTGTGKTHAALTLARALHGRDDALLRLDMSEFGERHTVARLLGAPAGYVGYGSGGILTEHVRRVPHSVILFDEIDKAHPDVLTVLLQILDTGTLTDAEGERADLRNTVIILTSNTGTETLTATDSLGFAAPTGSADFAAARETALRELRRTVRPEILDRLDHILVFRPLDTAAREQIARHEIVALRERLAQRGIRLRVRAGVPAAIAATATDGGGRAVRRTIRDLIETPVADAVAAGATTVAVTARQGSVTVQRA